MNRQSEKNTAIYCRIDYPGSPEYILLQKERALAYANQHNIENPILFLDDGFTGTTFDRPQFQNMMQEVKAGRVQTIIVTEIGRLVRGYTLFCTLLEQVLIPHGVTLISISDGLYYSPENSCVELVSPLVQSMKGGRN